MAPAAAPSREIGEPLDHGFDKSVPDRAWDAALCETAAAFRGGRLLGEVSPGTSRTPVEWECADAHRFTASTYLLLGAGHWCPTCTAQPERFAEQAPDNRFLAQVSAPERIRRRAVRHCGSPPAPAGADGLTGASMRAGDADVVRTAAPRQAGKHP